MNKLLIVKKIPIAMRITCLLLCLIVFQLQAEDVYSQKTKISLDMKNTTIEKVLQTIEEKSDYHFLYNNKLVNVDRKVSVRVKDAAISDVLDKLFKSGDVEYQVEGNQIILSPKEKITELVSGVESVQQQQKTITGKVTDINGEPIIGATILVKGTGQGTVTDMDGNYALQNVPEDAILQFSYVGMETQEIPVRGKTVINVAMKEATEQLGEIVVTALGIKREEKALGYSVQKVSGDDLSVIKGVNVATNLTGKVAGLLINNSSEISEKPTLKLRGENPLVVIDGIAYGNFSLNDLSPDDIESIDILKGATASSLYGVRGRAGAIMITTKKGRGKGLLINISNNTMISAGYLKIPKKQSSYSAGNYGELEYNSGYVWGDYMDGHEVEQYDPITMSFKKMPLLPRGKNNLKNFIRPSLSTNTNINVSQSGEFGSFRVSATQIHQNGQYPNTKLDKYIVNGGGNITYKKFKLDANLSYKKEMSPNLPRVDYGGGNIFYNLLIWTGNEFDVRDFKNYWKVKDQVQNWPYTAWYDNPYYIVYERINKNDQDLFNTNISMSYDILKNLSLMFRTGYDHYTSINENRRSIGDSGERKGYYAINESSGASFNNDFIVNANINWGDFLMDGVLGLSSYWYKDIYFNSNTRGGISVPGFYSLNASIERPNVSKSMDQKTVYSAYGKLGFSWKSAIFIEMTGRNDWSSTLPSSSRSYFYPSTSVSFLPTSFHNPFDDFLDFWKLRASWTIAKKDLGVYEINSVYNVSTDVWNGFSTALYPTTLRDPKVKPETERSYEFGTDFRFLGNRLGFDFTYFNRLRYDRLISAPVSVASGFNNMITNTQEELLQKGIEITLSGKPIKNLNFEWESSLNGGFWHWYYHKLDPIYSSKDPRLGKGERYDKFFIIDWERDPNGNIVHQAGLPVKNKFWSVMGYSDPKFIWGFTNRFKYKDFEVNFSFDGRIGGLMYSWTEQALWHAGTHPESDNQWRYDEVVNGKHNYVGRGVKITDGVLKTDAYGNVIEDTRKFALNDVPVSYQNYTTIYNENPWDHQAPHNIKDATFLKLREFALNYTLPNEIAQKMFLKNIQVGVIAQNLFMWTKEFRFSDPDRGKENLNSPTPRYFGININLNL